MRSMNSSLRTIVDGHLGSESIIELHVMLLAVIRGHAVADVVDGSGDGFQVVDDHGSCEYHVQIDRSTPEIVEGIAS